MVPITSWIFGGPRLCCRLLPSHPWRRTEAPRLPSPSGSALASWSAPPDQRVGQRARSSLGDESPSAVSQPEYTLTLRTAWRGSLSSTSLRQALPVPDTAMPWPLARPSAGAPCCCSTSYSGLAPVLLDVEEGVARAGAEITQRTGQDPSPEDLSTARALFLELNRPRRLMLAVAEIFLKRADMYFLREALWCVHRRTPEGHPKRCPTGPRIPPFCRLQADPRGRQVVLAGVFKEARRAAWRRPGGRRRPVHRRGPAGVRCLCPEPVHPHDERGGDRVRRGSRRPQQGGSGGGGVPGEPVPVSHPAVP